MRRLVQFIRLPSGDRRLLLEAAPLLWVVRLGLWLLPISKLTGLLQHAPMVRVRRDPAVDRFTWAVESASRLVVRPTCLVRALALETLLRRYGRKASLQIGVDKGEGKTLEAHAWVESEGKILLGGADVGRYKTLFQDAARKPQTGPAGEA